MARNMSFDVKTYPTKDTPGVTVVLDEHIKADGTTETVTLGELSKTRGEAGYRASAFINGVLTTLVGLYATRSQAGHAVRQAAEEREAGQRTVSTDATPAPTTSNLVTLDEAASRLCGGASNPLAALRKRISRGSVKTVETADGTMVDIGGEAA